MSTWINLAPIWVLQDYFPLIEQSGARRVIALSSTSRFTKADSSDTREQETAKRLAEAEEAFIAWAQDKGLDWVILRSTLIYGLGRDRNLSELARIIKRFRFFPLLGKALGRRQPVHADDVALACTAALEHPSPLGRSYELSGGEVLTYRQMIERIFLALGMKPRFVTIPLPLFCLAVRMLRLMPRYRGWSGAMAERMNRDLVFDHSEAERDLGFRPRGFELRSEDIPLD
jgi:nucleoside-diphosphate-sugar epimerase